jgi:DNA topoisomerase IA
MFLPYTYIFTARKSMTATPKRKTLDYSEEQSSSKKKRKKADEEEQTDHVATIPTNLEKLEEIR